MLNNYSIPTPPSSADMRDTLLLVVSVAEGQEMCWFLNTYLS